MKTLPWFLKKTSDMEHDDYMRMLKLVGFAAVNDWLYHVKILFS
jgi:hypothetical protein